MTIIEATQKALESSTGIYRDDWSEYMPNLFLIPTNTESGFLLDGIEDMKPGRRWNPHTEDILANDWRVLGKEMSK